MSNIASTVGSPSPYEFGKHLEYSVKIKVDRSLRGHERLKSTLVGGRILSGTSQGIEQLPFRNDLPEEVELVFFPIQGSCDRPDIERAHRGLLQDLAAQFAYNAQDPIFGDYVENVDLWRDGDGKWEFVSFWKNEDEEYGRIAFGGYGESIELFDHPLVACGVRFQPNGSTSLA